MSDSGTSARGGPTLETALACRPFHKGSTTGTPVEPELVIRRLVGAHELRPARLRQMDSLVEAWLPGSGGEGVADPLFAGASNTGKLRVTWPRTLAQEPINVGDRDYDPLYPYGFRLRTK